MSQEQKEALANVIMTMSDMSDTIPTEADLHLVLESQDMTADVSDGRFLVSKS